jgi:hypothetical protein
MYVKEHLPGSLLGKLLSSGGGGGSGSSLKQRRKLVFFLSLQCRVFDLFPSTVLLFLFVKFIFLIFSDVTFFLHGLLVTVCMLCS